MRILRERAEVREHNGLTTLHAEIELETEKGKRFVQAHDNSMNRYYELSRQSWFELELSGEEEEDPEEEYFTAEGAQTEEAEEPDFMRLLQQHDRRTEPYESSEYADVFVKADRLLDDLIEDLDA